METENQQPTKAERSLNMYSNIITSLLFIRYLSIALTMIRSVLKFTTENVDLNSNNPFLYIVL